MLAKVKSLLPTSMPSLPAFDGEPHSWSLLAAIIFDLVSLVFVIVGLGAWSFNISNNTLVPWGVLRNAETISSKVYLYEVYLGLRGFLIYPTSDLRDLGASNNFSKYSSCSNAVVVCNTCRAAGNTSLGLYILAVFFLSADIFINIKRLKSENSGLKFANMGLSGVSFVFIIASVINFTLNCTYGDWTDVLLMSSSNINVTKDIGTAEILGIAAVILTFISCFVTQGLEYFFYPDSGLTGIASEVNLQEINNSKF